MATDLLSRNKRGISQWLLDQPKASDVQEADIISEATYSNPLERINPGSYEVEEQFGDEKEQAELPKPPVGLREVIKTAGLFPHERSGRGKEIAEERLSGARERFDIRSEGLQKMNRVGALAQGIQAVADLFIMNQKGNDPAAVGSRHGLNLSNEATERLEAERMVFEQELEAYYNRMFAEAQAEEQVDQANTQMANQVIIANTKAQIEALTEQLSAYESGALTPGQLETKQYAEFVNRLISRGQYDQAMEIGKRYGIFDEDMNVNFDRALPQAEQEGAARTPQRSRADALAIHDFERINQEIAEAQSKVEDRRKELQGAVPDTDPAVQRLNQLQEQKNSLLENEQVAEYHTNRRYEQEILLPAMKSQILSAQPGTDQYTEAYLFLYDYFSSQGFNDQEINNALGKMGVRGFRIPDRMASSFEGFRKQIRENDGSDEVLNKIRAEMISWGMLPADAEHYVRALFMAEMEESE